MRNPAGSSRENIEIESKYFHPGFHRRTGQPL
jgi:hypothetical protein